MTKLGVAFTAACWTVLVAEFVRHRRRPLPLAGWLALAVLAAAQWAMFRKIEPVATFFTPLAWTCWIFLADAALRAMADAAPAVAPLPPTKSTALWAHLSAGERWKIALLSVPLWTIFEIYNLRLVNWTYVGLPANVIVRYFGYAWSFATITPGIFVTADLLQAFGWFGASRQRTIKLRTLDALTMAGAVLLVLPVVLPPEVGSYLFALIWIGFILLLDPINCRLRLPSLSGDWVAGRPARLWSLLASGFICGWLWEFWNYWASAKWLYIFPIFQDWKIFEMPVPGFLGFPPFALECFTMYVTANWAIQKTLQPQMNTDKH